MPYIHKLMVRYNSPTKINARYALEVLTYETCLKYKNGLSLDRNAHQSIYRLKNENRKSNRE